MYVLAKVTWQYGIYLTLTVQYTNNFIFKDVKGCQNCSRIQLCSPVKTVRFTGAAGEFLPEKCQWYIIDTKPGSLFIMQDLNC
jgi:hypothetical protein